MAGQFYKMPREIMARNDLTATDKLVYAVILDRIGSNGKAWPGLRKLAAAVGSSLSSLTESTARLRRAGLIVVADGNRGKSNVYSLPSTVPESNTLLPLEGVPESGVPDSGTVPENEQGVPESNTPCTGKQYTSVPETEHIQTQTQFRPTIQTSSGEAPGDDAKPSGKPKTPKRVHHDPHADAFKAAFDSAFPEPYAWQQGDFVQLATWRKSYPAVGPERFVEVARAAWGKGKFRPSSSLTIRGMCASWAQLAAGNGNGAVGTKELSQGMKEALASAFEKGGK